MSSPPVKYARQANFSSFEANSPTTPKPGSSLDAEFDAIKTAGNKTIDRLGEIQRSDGKLANLSVHKDALASDVRAMVASGKSTPRGDWLTATDYVAFDLVTHNDGTSDLTYIVISDHTSGVFDTDLAAGKLMLFSAPLPEVLAAVQANADAAQAARDDAEAFASSASAQSQTFDQIVDTEPLAPAIGDRILLSAANGVHPGEIAEYYSTGWKYFGTPKGGQEAIDTSTGVVHRYGGNSGEWYPIGVLLGSAPSNAAAYTAALGTGVPLMLDANYVAGADVDLSAIVIEPIGGKIVSNGHNVTIGRVGMPPSGQLFDISGGGSIIPNGYQYAEVTPELFCAKGDGLTSDAVQLNAANTFLYKRGGGIIKCGMKVYASGSVWNIDNHVGVEAFVSVIKFTAADAYLHVRKSTGVDYVAGEVTPFDTNRYNKIGGLVIDCGNTANIGMQAGNVVARHFDKLVISNYKEYGAVFAGTQNSVIDLLNCISNDSDPYAAVKIKNAAAGLRFNIPELMGGSSTDGTDTSCVEFAIDADEGAGTLFSADHISFNEGILEYGSPKYSILAPDAAPARRVHWNRTQINQGSVAMGLVGAGSNGWSFDRTVFNMNNTFKKGLLLHGFGTLLKKPEFINPASVAGTDACIEYWNKFRCEGWSNGLGTSTLPVNIMFLNHTGGNPEDYMTFVPNEVAIASPQTFSVGTATGLYFNTTTKQWEQQIGGVTYATAALKFIGETTINITPGTINAGVLYGPQAFTVSGAQIGDVVRVKAPYSLQKGIVWGIITSTGNGNLYIKNEDPSNSIGAFAAGDFVIRVFREQT